MQKFFQKIVFVMTVLVGLTALFGLGAFLPRFVPVEDWFGGWYTFRVVSSGSMEPSIGVGSLVATWPTGDYAAGDVVTFQDVRGGKIPTTHRIIEITTKNGNEGYITKGDANEERDYEPIKKEDILGEVFLVVPYAGYTSAYAGTSKGSVVLMMLAFIGFSGWFGIERYQRTQKKKTDQNE